MPQNTVPHIFEYILRHSSTFTHRHCGERPNGRSGAGRAGEQAVVPAARPSQVFRLLIAGASDIDPTTVATMAVIGATTVYGLSWLAILIFPILAGTTALWWPTATIAFCASYHLDEDTEIPCRMVALSN